MRRTSASLVMVMVSAAIAEAEPALEFQFGVGVRHALGAGSFDTGFVDPSSDHSVAFDGSIAVQVSSTQAIGLRGSVATSRRGSVKDWGMVFYDEYEHAEMPLELAVVVSRRIGRVSFAPWVGVHSHRHTVGMRGCGPFLQNQPAPDCPQDAPYTMLDDRTDWSPISPLVGGSVAVDIVRVSGATLGVAAYAQYTATLPSAGLDLVMRL